MRRLTSNTSRSVTIGVMASLLATTACQSLQTSSYPRSTIPADSTQMIVGATTLAGERVVFDRRAREHMQGGVLVPAVPGARIEDGTIVGTLNGDPQMVPLAELTEILIAERGISVVRTVILAGATAFAVLFFVGAYQVSESGVFD